MALVDYVHQPLKWEQPHTFKMEYVLHSNLTVVAELKFRSSWGTLATGESAEGCWTFKRVGFFQTRATIRACGSEEEMAVFYQNTWSQGGTLVLADGRKYRAATNFWSTELRIETEAGERLVTLKPGGFIHMSAGVEIAPAAARLPELPWLVMFAWYLALMLQQDATTIAATAAAT